MGKIYKVQALRHPGLFADLNGPIHPLIPFVKEVELEFFEAEEPEAAEDELLSVPESSELADDESSQAKKARTSTRAKIERNLFFINPHP